MSRISAADLDDLVLDLVDRGQLPRSTSHQCPYLEGLEAREEGFVVERLRPRTYHDLMNRGYRRSGRVFYRPRCDRCARCVQLRVACSDFKLSKSQRRTRNRNQDVHYTAGEPELTDEKYDLYCRYLEQQHPGSSQSDDRNGLREFLYVSSVDTLEICYRDSDDKLLAISLVDVSEWSLSSVYHFFDPVERNRRMGVYSVLAEIEFARSRNIPYYYLGYWIEGAKTMTYKASFYPHEILLGDRWHRREHRGASLVPAPEEP